MSRALRFLATVITLGVCCAGPLLGQTDSDQPDETLPGFKATNVYHDFGSVDHVNLFSGDTGIVIPLGPEYPLSPGLSWQLKAYHSAKMWKYDSHCTNGKGALGHGVITGYPTLGVGWTLDVGHIGQSRSGWFCQSPDGGRHNFLSGVLPSTTTQYTTWDGTHERVTWYPALSYFTVEFPGGGTQYFEHAYTRPVPLNGDPSPDFNDQYYGATPDTRWGLTRFVDRFSVRVLQVNYAGTEPWMITSIVPMPDGTARPITFNWTAYQVVNTGAPITDPTGPPTLNLSPIWRVLQSIGFPTVASGTLTTTFNFTPGTFKRSGYFDGVSASTCPADSTTPSFVAVPLLSSIAESGNLVDQKWLFTYNGQTSSPWPFGALLTLQLPTNGTIQYSYGGTSTDCPISPSCPGPSVAAHGTNTTIGPRPDFFSFTDASPAVSSRQEKDSNNTLSTVNYDRSDYWVSLSPTSYSTTQTVREVRVHRPDGNGNTIADRYLFHVSLSTSLVSTDTTSGLELAHYSYDRDVPGTPTPVPIRAVVSCYDMDLPDRLNKCGYATGSTYTSSWITEYGGSNPRLQKRATWYGDNPASTLTVNGGDCTQTATIPCWQNAFSGYNANAGEYATETKTANNGSLMATGGATWQSRTTTTFWNPQTGASWLLKLFTARQVEDHYSNGCPVNAFPCSVVSNYAFSTLTGFLQNVQRTDQTIVGGPITAFINRAFTPDSFGNPVTELITASGSEFSADQFTKARTFQNGLLLTRKQEGLAPSWKAVDVRRDTTTGAITSSLDPNGWTTTYGYDALNRLSSVTPPTGEVATTYCYKLMSDGSAYNYVLAKKGGTSVTSCVVDDGAPGLGSGALEAYQYDGLGRIIREIRRQPNTLSSGSYFALRQTSYNAAGLPSFVSEWTPCSGGTNVTSCFATDASSGYGTHYQNYDFLGRARLIIAADDTPSTPSRTTKSFDDTIATPVIKNSDFSEFTAVANVGGQSVAWASRKDFLNRVLVVTDPTNGTIPAFGTLTYYDYNVLNKLTDAKVNNTQERDFTYDALGLLRSEKHPETGMTTYTDAASYDALGNVKKKAQGGHTYTYAYDAASRLNTVAADGSTYVSNFYDGLGFAGGTYPLGRLTQQNSYHPSSSPNIQIQQNYTYSGLAGRLSSKSLNAINGTTFFSPSESFVYNTLGLLDTHNHARTSGTWSVTTGYTSGLPTQITSNNATYVSSAKYNPAGGLQSYVTGNGVTTTITQDSSLLPRPLSIVTSGADQNFSSGVYSYDGAGNIKSIGTDTFLYDARSRLTKATYLSSGSQYDILGYDDYGNLNSRTSELGVQDGLAVNTLTNQLSGPTYDLLGNLKLNGPDQHTYDPLSRQTQYVGINANERYFYDAGGERVARVVDASSLPRQSTQERFYNLTPCRILDTRNATGAYGGPSIGGQGSRSFAVSGICGIPAAAKSLALNVTTVGGVTTANVRLYPTGLSYQPLGTANAYKAGYTRANQTFGSIDGPTAGSFTLFNDGGYPVNVIVDVQGYFAPGPNTPPQTGDSRFFTLRDSQNRPSTEYRWDSATPTTTLLKDHVYLGNLLVADYTWTGQPNGLVFYTNDHLGTPRFMTEGTVPKWMATFKYRAFGLALTPQLPGQGIEFASMERDLASSDLYDHARYMAGKLPRFKSPDQLGGHVEDPQSWNRYAYARNNPLKYVDRDGRAVQLSVGVSEQALEHRNQKAALAALTSPQALRAGWSNGNYWFEIATAATNTVLGDPTLDVLPGPIAIEVQGERGLLKLTSGNFRKNLMRFLGKTAEEIAEHDAHHMLAQADKFATRFSEAGLNIHDPKFGAFWDRATHRGLSSQFNADWTTFLSKERTAEQIQNFARVLAVKYDIPW